MSITTIKMSMLTADQLADYDHVEIIGDITPPASDLESYEKNLKDAKPSVDGIKRIFHHPKVPMSFLDISDPENPFDPKLMHRPDCVLVIPRIYSQKIAGVIDPEPHTLIASEVFHYGGPITKPNFAAGGIEQGDPEKGIPAETVIQAAFREGSVEEIPAVKAEYIRRAVLLEQSYVSIGDSTQKSYIVLLDVLLPPGVDVKDLDGQIGGGDHIGEDGEVTERESVIISRVEKLQRDLRKVVCGASDKLAIHEALLYPALEINKN